MIKKIIKKVINELWNPEDRKTRNIFILEMILLLLYLVCFIITCQVAELAEILYIIRWSILIVSGLIWWIYERKEKQRK